MLPSTRGPAIFTRGTSLGTAPALSAVLGTAPLLGDGVGVPLAAGAPAKGAGGATGLGAGSSIWKPSRIATEMAIARKSRF